jgi:hypothetical protein
VDPAEQAPLTPFLATSAGRETAAQRKAFGFERRERGCDLLWRETKRRHKRILRDRPLAFQTAAQDFDQRLVRGQLLRSARGGRDNRWCERRARPKREELRQALGRDP